MFLALFLLACKDYTLDSRTHVCDVTTTDISLEDTSLGFSALDTYDVLGPTLTYTITWWEESPLHDETLTISLSPPQSATRVDATGSSCGGGRRTDSSEVWATWAYMEVTTNATFTTSDGSITAPDGRLTWEVTSLQGSSPAALTFIPNSGLYTPWPDALWQAFAIQWPEDAASDCGTGESIWGPADAPSFSFDYSCDHNGDDSPESSGQWNDADLTLR